MSAATPTALLTSELGIGMGHARRLLPIARELKRRGWRPVVAMRELWVCTDEFRDAGIELLQAPAHRGYSGSGAPFMARGYADVMAACGYASVEALWPTVVGWDWLLALVDPQVLIADYSPIAALAACGRVPMIAIGDGFVLPPPHLSRLPVLRHEGTVMADESVMLDNAREVQRRLGRSAAPRSLPALLGGQAHVVCCFPELDIYARLREVPAQGPLEPLRGPLPPPTRGAVFAYLAAGHASTRKALQAMIDTGLPAEAYVRDCPADLSNALRMRGAIVHDAPPPLADVMARSSVLLHHGGIGTTQACLALGRPQVLMPQHLEQSLNSTNLARWRASDSIGVADSLERMRAVFIGSATSVPFSQRASEIAAGIFARGQHHALNAVLQAAESLAQAGPLDPAKQRK